ncbi:MAG: hypothetical protein GF334_08140 [Candidatus Altiarchaeales archaeon]|nr:hypothetical protein [Candidatus Altiarchaeales archaeon]
MLTEEQRNPSSKRMKEAVKWSKKQGSGNGKGSAPRPVDKARFDENYDEIDWSAHRNK